MIMKYFILAIILIVLIIIFQRVSTAEAVYIQSPIDREMYLVMNEEDKDDAAKMLSQIKQNIHKLRDYLWENKEKYPKYKQYIEQLHTRINGVIISENGHNSVYTSYSVNKGDEIVLCLRSKTNGQLHDINLVMYVVLHEISHVACPEIDHTPLFKEIFIFHLEVAEKIGIYRHVPYDVNPHEYCGMTISENLLKR